MPIPKPKKGERHDAFIERCMGNASMNTDYPDNAQRYAICETTFTNRKSITLDELLTKEEDDKE